MSKFTNRWFLFGSLGLNVLLLGVLAFQLPRGEAPAAPQSEIVALSATPTVASVAEATIAPTATPLSEQEPSATPVAEQPTATPTPTPTPTPLPSPTVIPAPPTATPEPSPTASPTAVPGPDWLTYLNSWRTAMGVPPVAEDTLLSQDAQMHAIYMVKVDEARHSQNSTSEYFTTAGNASADRSNLAAGFSISPYEWTFDYWLSAPFHAIPMLDPALTSVGYGLHQEENGLIQTGGVLDVQAGLLQGSVSEEISYPVVWPPADGETWVIRHKLPEFPDPAASCGYQRPFGAPIMIITGSGDGSPRVNSHRLYKNGEGVPSCVFTENTYLGSTDGMQYVGRIILDTRDAVVIIPQQPLEVGATYTVDVVIDGETLNWSFEAVNAPG